MPTKFHREGIKYSELSEEEKAEYEEKFSDPVTEELFVKEIESSALNDWLFNANTVDQILSHIMQNGIKIFKNSFITIVNGAMNLIEYNYIKMTYTIQTIVSIGFTIN